MNARRVASLLLAVMVAGLSGCGPASTDSPGPSQQPEAVAGVAGEMEAPDLAYTEWRLPDGAMLHDHSNRFAALLDNNFDGVGGVRIRLLDMETGTHRVVVSETIGRAEGYLTLGLHCSDEWMAWEEIRGDEVSDPLDVEWRLWAAPIDAEDTAVGTPLLIRKSVVSIRSRPLFAVQGDTLYVMSNTYPNAKQEGAAYRSSIEAIDLATSTEREIYSSDRMLHVFSVQDDDLIVSEYVDHDTAECRIRVLGLDDGAERFSYDPGELRLSHWPAYLDGTLLWARDDGANDSNDPWPSLWCLTRDGTTLSLTEDGLDPVIVGPYIFFRRYVSGPSQSGRPREWAIIAGLELATMRTFELLRTNAASEGYWQPMIDGRSDAHSYVVWSQLFAADVGAERGGTYVRRYYIP